MMFFSPQVFSTQRCEGVDSKNCLLEYKLNQPTNIDLNIDKSSLKPCSFEPMTGFQRDGYCRYFKSDRGQHFVCAEVTEEFLEYTKNKGNDLSTPNPRYNFKGLVPGDRWCLCVSRVIEANRDGISLKVIREATHIESGF